MAQVKEEIKTPENELNDGGDSQPIRCRVQNTGNQDAHRLVEYAHKIEEEDKTMKSEIKENVQGSSSERKETGTQINNLEQKKEINI